MPQVLARADDERGLPVVVERAAPHQVGPGPVQFDPGRGHQALQGHFCL